MPPQDEAVLDDPQSFDVTRSPNPHHPRRPPHAGASRQSFDVTRSPNPHLSFGIGAQFCLGVHLARLEGRVFVEALLARFGRVELAGEPVRPLPNLSNALKSLPVRLA